MQRLTRSVARRGPSFEKIVSCMVRHIALIVLSSLRAASALVVTSPPASAATAGPSRRPTARRAQDLLPVPETLRLHTCVPNEPSGLTSGRGSAPQHNALTSRARSSLSECRVRSVASRQARLQTAPSARRPPPHQTSVAERRLPLDTTPSTSGGGRRAGVGAARQRTRLIGVETTRCRHCRPCPVGVVLCRRIETRTGCSGRCC